jgi:ABC-type dipeptide/oligopeptide/nickel transport system permease component
MLQRRARRLLTSLPVLLAGSPLLQLAPGDVTGPIATEEGVETLWPTAELLITCLVWSVPAGIALGAPPALTPGSSIPGPIVPMTRTSALEAMSRDHVRAAPRTVLS